MRNEKRRLAALAAAVRPARSMAARVERLSEDQRRAYQEWRVASDRWHTQFEEPDGAYVAILNGNSGPTLRLDIRDALFGAEPPIPASATLEEVAEIYQRFLEEGQ